MSPLYHRLEIYVLDFEKYGIEDVCMNLSNIDGFHFKVAECQTTAIPNWSDEHELNKSKCPIETRRKYFDIKQMGQYVDIPLKPKTELELENETLKQEIKSLKIKLEKIKNIV